MDGARLAAWLCLLAAVGGCASDEPGDSSGGLDGECTEFSRTPYPGDCLALPVPPPDQGIQIHYGPKSYSKADMAPFIIESGDETVDVQYAISTNDEPILFNAYQQRLRPGAHHVIVAHGEGEQVGLNTEQELAPLAFETLFGAQAGAVDVPTPGMPIAEEDRGIAFTMGPRRNIAMNAHFINTSGGPLLREGWFNIYFADPATITTIAAPMFLIGGLGMEVQPGEDVVLKFSTPAPQDLRIVWAFGHFHSHTLRMTAYKVDAATAERTLIYETYDYRDPLYVGYNSLIETPLPDREAKQSGAYTGLLELKKGDVVEWECHIVNNDNFVLKFANELLTAEMCGFFGFYAPAPNGKTWRIVLP